MSTDHISLLRMNDLSAGNEAASTERSRKPSRLWIWFLVAFCLQAAAWTTWISIASHHKVQEVPLETSPASPQR